MSVLTISAIKADVGGYVGHSAIHPELLRGAQQRVAGWMRGSHNGPLMPCALADAHPARFDRSPRVVAMGFQLADGKLIGPRDLLGDISFDRARRQALEMADYMRHMGPFEPGRLPMEDMEYTTMPRVAKRMRERWEAIEEPTATFS